MKKNVLAAIIAAAAMAAAFVGCNPDTDKPTPTEAATTENAEAATTETTEPVTTETAENTAEAANPTEEAKYAVLDFNECAEEVLRLKPYVGNALPDDADGYTVLYAELEASNAGPNWFGIDGEKIYVSTFPKMLIYDKGVYVKSVEIDGVVSIYCLDSNIYDYYGVRDADTLEYKLKTEQESFEDSISIAYRTYEVHPCLDNGRPGFITYVLDKEAGSSSSYYFDEANAVWKEDKLLCTYKLDDEDVVTATLSNGKECRFFSGDCSLIGLDEAGYLYFQVNDYSVGSTPEGAIDIIFEMNDSIAKVDSDGNIVSLCTIPFDKYEDLWDMSYHTYVLPDGTVYVSTATNDAYVIWKINM